MACTHWDAGAREGGRREVNHEAVTGSYAPERRCTTSVPHKLGVPSVPSTFPLPSCSPCPISDPSFESPTQRRGAQPLIPKSPSPYGSNRGKYVRDRTTCTPVGLCVCSRMFAYAGLSGGQSRFWVKRRGAVPLRGRDNEQVVDPKATWTQPAFGRAGWCSKVLLAVRRKRASTCPDRVASSLPSRRRSTRTLVSTTESVPGSDHVAVPAVPAAKSSDHVVPSQE